jgi:hypothetical protein
MQMSSRKLKNIEHKPLKPFTEKTVMGANPGELLSDAAVRALRVKAYLWPFPSQAPCRVLLDQSRRWVIQVWEELGVIGTPWEGALRVAMKYHAEPGKSETGTSIQSWDTIQNIKEFIWPGRLAVEMYPPQEKVVNVAPMRWIWILPESITQTWPLSIEAKPMPL